MNAESIPVVVDAVSEESPRSCETAKPASASTHEAAPSVASKEQPVPPSSRKDADDAVPLSDSAIVVLEKPSAAPPLSVPTTWRSPVSLLKPKPISSEAVSIVPDTRARDSMSPVWMNARKGAKPAGAVVGASTILFFVTLVLAIAGSSALALVYVGPEGHSRARATAGPSRIEAAAVMTSNVPVVMPSGPTLPLVVTEPEAPPATLAAQPTQPQTRPASPPPAKQLAPAAAAPARPAPAKAARTTPTPPIHAKRATPPARTTTRARLSIRTSPY